MNKPSLPFAPTKPVRPERSKVVPKYHQVEANNLQQVIDHFASIGFTDLGDVTFGECRRYDEHEYYTAEWSTKEIETQTDAQWAKTIAEYEAAMTLYREKEARYQAQLAKYHTDMVTYDAWKENETKTRELKALADLRAKYPDAMNKPSLPSKPVEPKEPQRTVTKTETREMNLYGNETIATVMERLREKGCPDSENAVITQDYEQIVVTWEQQREVTQSDEQWAKTQLKYRAKLATYQEKAARYEEQMSRYEADLMLYKRFVDNDTKARDLKTLAALKRLYPDA